MALLDIERRFLGLKCMVGNTPLLAIHFTYRGRQRTIYAKAENLNMTGSIKDRMALHILQQADDNKKYLSTDLLREEPTKADFLAHDVQLIGFRAFKRVCYTCCDPEECMENIPPDFLAAEEALPPCPRRPTPSS